MPLTPGRSVDMPPCDLVHRPTGRLSTGLSPPGMSYPQPCAGERPPLAGFASSVVSIGRSCPVQAVSVGFPPPESPDASYAPTWSHDLVNAQRQEHGEVLWTTLCTACLPEFGRSGRRPEKNFWDFSAKLSTGEGVNLWITLWTTCGKLLCGCG